MSLKLNERYPGRFNNPSADYPGGSFKNRTTPTAKDGSYLEQDWANDKEGFFQSLLSAAGLTANGLVDKVGSSQAFDAMGVLAQRQSGVYFATTGTSTAQILTPTPALPGYVVGVRYNVVFNVASGLNPNIKVSGLNGKLLKQYDATGAKVQAVWSAGQPGDIFYDGTDFVLLNPAMGIAQATESVLGGLKVATQAQVDAGTDDLTGVTPKKLAAKALNTLNLSLGYAEKTQDLTASRTINTQYTNATGRPIFLIILVADAGGSGTFQLTVNGIVFDFGNPSTGTQQISFIIPPGETYGPLVTGGNTLIKWAEFRP